MKTPLAASLLLLSSACATAAGAAAAPDALPPAADAVVVVPVDGTPRPAVVGGDVTVVTYLDIPQSPIGCGLVARLLVEAPTLSRVREALAHRAGELGATLLVVSNRNEVRTETSTSRAGVGLAIVSNRYTLDAYDCR